MTSQFAHILFDWGNTLMVDNPDMQGPMMAWPELSVVEGAIETLIMLNKKGICCHLATNAKNSNEEQIRSALSRVDINQYIQRVFCYTTIGHAKPSQAFFDAIAFSLGCTKSELLMIGDNLDNDVKGALACGLSAIWFNPAKLPTPTGVNDIYRLTELFDIFFVNDV
ncbi:HAD family hydrolase [Spartinivicinus ruber]|uniref:HAD family hydrolase n=1 Tax=Spartinivicinus ruber TaxID=2683272 RepID=UPI0013D8A729|nr:HAD family hydrolase [Spartinivicinus ruber]